MFVPPFRSHYLRWVDRYYLVLLYGGLVAEYVLAHA